MRATAARIRARPRYAPLHERPSDSQQAPQTHLFVKEERRSRGKEIERRERGTDAVVVDGVDRGLPRLRRGVLHRHRQGPRSARREEEEEKRRQGQKRQETLRQEALRQEGQRRRERRLEVRQRQGLSLRPRLARTRLTSPTRSDGVARSARLFAIAAARRRPPPPPRRKGPRAGGGHGGTPPAR